MDEECGPRGEARWFGQVRRDEHDERVEEDVGLSSAKDGQGRRKWAAPTQPSDLLRNCSEGIMERLHLCCEASHLILGGQGVLPAKTLQELCIAGHRSYSSPYGSGPDEDAISRVLDDNAHYSQVMRQVKVRFCKGQEGVLETLYKFTATVYAKLLPVTLIFARLDQVALVYLPADHAKSRKAIVFEPRAGPAFRNAVTRFVSVRAVSAHLCKRLDVPEACSKTLVYILKRRNFALKAKLQEAVHQQRSQIEDLETKLSLLKERERLKEMQEQQQRKTTEVALPEENHQGDELSSVEEKRPTDRDSGEQFPQAPSPISSVSNHENKSDGLMPVSKNQREEQANHEEKEGKTVQAESYHQEQPSESRQDDRETPRQRKLDEDALAKALVQVDFMKQFVQDQLARRRSPPRQSRTLEQGVDQLEGPRLQCSPIEPGPSSAPQLEHRETFSFARAETKSLDRLQDDASQPFGQEGSQSGELDSLKLLELEPMQRLPARRGGDSTQVQCSAEIPAAPSPSLQDLSPSTRSPTSAATKETETSWTDEKLADKILTATEFSPLDMDSPSVPSATPSAYQMPKDTAAGLIASPENEMISKKPTPRFDDQNEKQSAVAEWTFSPKENTVDTKVLDLEDREGEFHEEHESSLADQENVRTEFEQTEQDRRTEPEEADGRATEQPEQDGKVLSHEADDRPESSPSQDLEHADTRAFQNSEGPLRSLEIPDSDLHRELRQSRGYAEHVVVSAPVAPTYQVKEPEKLSLLEKLRQHNLSIKHERQADSQIARERRLAVARAVLSGRSEGGQGAGSALPADSLPSQPFVDAFPMGRNPDAYLDLMAMSASSLSVMSPDSPNRDFSVAEHLEEAAQEPHGVSTPRDAPASSLASLSKESMEVPMSSRDSLGVPSPGALSPAFATQEKHAALSHDSLGARGPDASSPAMPLDTPSLSQESLGSQQHRIPSMLSRESATTKCEHESSSSPAQYGGNKAPVSIEIPVEESDQKHNERVRKFEQLRARKLQEDAVRKQRRAQHQGAPFAEVGMPERLQTERIPRASEGAPDSLQRPAISLHSARAERGTQGPTLWSDAIQANASPAVSRRNAGYGSLHEPALETRSGDIFARLHASSSHSAERRAHHPPPEVAPPEIQPTIAIKSKSNLKVVMNAIAHGCLAGPHHLKRRQLVLQSLEQKSQAFENAQYVILFRNEVALKFRGVFVVLQGTGRMQRLQGSKHLPELLDASMVDNFYKYNTGQKRFQKLSTKSLTKTTDAISLNPKFFPAAQR